MVASKQTDKVDSQVSGKTNMVFTSKDDLDAHLAHLQAVDKKIENRILVCNGTGCAALGAMEVHGAFTAECAKAGVDVQVELETCAHTPNPTLLAVSGCQGLCQAGPLVQIGDILYTGVKPDGVKEIVEKTLLGGQVVEKRLYKNPIDGKRLPHRNDLPFYKDQIFVALEGCGRVAADSLDSYILAGGFGPLAKALLMDSNALIEEIEKSGLRGRGGGGFPTGRKWRSCVNAPGDERFVVCNGDEGDPGAFMDSCIMEGDPFRVIEGMIICAHGIGSRRGFIYVRHEYPGAVSRLSGAIEVCRSAGLLGENILGSDLCFDVRIVRGGGAFVCGESTALMRSIEGKIGEPRAKYTRSVEKGLHDQPTVLNNVETFACIPSIVRDGAGKFAALGTDKSKGTKVFCLVGKIVNTGLIEVPMGTTLREIIFRIGGGILEGRPFKAVQTGGPSGGCLGKAELDLQVDFEELAGAGSMMGSGGMIVMDDNTCMVDVARYFLKFLMSESCGKCVPCREGIYQLHAILERICNGKGHLSDLDKIERLGEDMRASSLCGLGKSAPNPVLSTLGNFREEYVAHIEQKKCPAGVCRALTTFYIDKDNCTGCLLCKKACPEACIAGEKNSPHVIDTNLCTQCGACRAVCKYNAVLTL